MQHEPLFQRFDAGWVFLIVLGAGFFAYAMALLARQAEPSDDNFDDFERKHSAGPEDDARRTPF